MIDRSRGMWRQERFGFEFRSMETLYSVQYAYALLFMDWREDPVSSKLRISTLRMLPCAASLLWMEKNIHGRMGNIAPMQTRTHGLQSTWQTRTSGLPGKRFLQALVGYPVRSASAGLTRQHTVSQEHHVD